MASDDFYKLGPGELYDPMADPSFQHKGKTLTELSKTNWLKLWVAHQKCYSSWEQWPAIPDPECFHKITKNRLKMISVASARRFTRIEKRLSRQDNSMEFRRTATNTAFSAINTAFSGATRHRWILTGSCVILGYGLFLAVILLKK